ncbi:MAG: methionine biosynthesis protein MetW [Candidatus Omnitrophica bacterium]|nr:methionine biosynthesis protein MetW [Candidatus Omnitrophota bacterium]MDE2009691.1 methionine biosynthesis protein MetW [Candidatus Omnitrophota bacterium]MDE2213912.1 methionine biosynthesis protein MetW [Candidatus Omnitrophota bacterium]MDE2231829.1 methionine biosynthesis protein MetW [Candidatus Omnitrophota bacterium]
MRPDHKYILEMIEPDSRVLDLGCGDGELLGLLMEHKNCRAAGIEINEKEIYKCIERGVSVSHGDIDSGLADYSDRSFDYVILNESLQEVLNPDRVIAEALRVGRKAIVGIPNFCNLSARLQIFFLGRVPVTEGLPYKWYNTPNLRFLSIKDFRDFCAERSIVIERECAFNSKSKTLFAHNLFSDIAIFLIRK